MTQNSFSEKPNKLIDYSKSNDFITITDSLSLLRYEPADRISYFLQPLLNDSSKKRFIYRVKEGIIKSNNYQWDLLLLIDNSENGQNAYYTLESYDNKRNQIGHLDFAYWSDKRKNFVSGRIDCDSDVHIILDDRNENRIFKIDKSGNMTLLETKKNHE